MDNRYKNYINWIKKNMEYKYNFTKRNTSIMLNYS